MNWYSTNSDTFPAVVSRVLLPEGTEIHACYVIEKAVRVCGTELTYLARDSRTQEQIYLHELLPMRWCMRDENGSWTPYQTEAGSVFDSVKSACLAKLDQLKSLQQETALEHILDVFEANGTIWFVSEFAEQESLAQTLGSHLFTPQEAIDLLTPVLDTLAGLHAESICHGAVSAQSIVLRKDTAVLTSWCTHSFSEENVQPSVSDDVQAVSRLLYQMMTGEQVYSKESAAVLPSGIRNALRMGMESMEMSMEQLWEQLHADRAAKRSRKLVQPAGNSHSFSKRFTLIFCLLCVFLPLLAGLLIVFGSQLRDAAYQLTENEIRVPELLYLSQEEAVETAESLGLHVIIAAREDNPVIAENLVVTQKPSAGALLKAGDTVQLIVSDGWSNYVPNVCNMLFEDAKSRLEELGFIVVYKEIMSAGDAPGTVITQSISPDTELPRDYIIQLQVSLGRSDLDTSKFEMVGNYVGMNFDEAKNLLSDLHLYALQAETVYDAKVPEGVVISQDVPEGRRVRQGTVVKMKVSLGVEKVRVPHVQLMNAATAKSMLERMRLKAVLVYSASDRYAMDSVISQNIPSGKLVPVGSEIWLTVSTGKPNTVVSTGGWSGNPLPTVDITETSAADTTETIPVETDTSLTESSDPTEPAPTEAIQTETVASDTVAPTDPTETTAVTETKAATEAAKPPTAETAAPEVTQVPDTTAN